MKIFLLIFIVLLVLNNETNAQVVEKSVRIAPPKQDDSRFVYVPFDVPQNTKSISVRFDFDKKNGANGLNFGLFETGFSGSDSDRSGFRGYSGYVRDVIFIAEDRATHGYRAGKIPSGKWFVLVGLSKVVPEGVELKLQIKFNRIDQTALEQFESERAKTFKHEKFERQKPARFNGLTWFRGDLHAHTVHGDGTWTVKGLLDSASANGLDFLSLTEHNTFTHHNEIDEERKNYPNLMIIRGEEVTTFGAHINVWGLPTGEWVDFRVPPGKAASGKQIADAARKLGGLASINHPTMGCGGCSWTYGDDWSVMDSVEIWNATWDVDDEDALKIWDGYLQKGKRITAIASSDSHQPPYETSPYPTNLAAGNPGVVIGAKTLSEQDLFFGIKTGRVYMTENPRQSIRFNAGRNKTIGDMVALGKNSKVRLNVALNGFERGASLSWISDGKILRKTTVSGTKFSESFAFTMLRDSYVRLEVRGKDGKMMGMTNPIFFERR